VLSHVQHGPVVLNRSSSGVRFEACGCACQRGSSADPVRTSHHLVALYQPTSFARPLRSTTHIAAREHLRSLHNETLLHIGRLRIQLLEFRDIDQR